MGKKWLQSLDFAEIQPGCEEQQEGEEGKKSYCKGISHRHPGMI